MEKTDQKMLNSTPLQTIAQPSAASGEISSGVKAVDIASTERELLLALQYIAETRHEFETDGVPMPWVTEAVSALEQAKRTIQRAGVDFAEDLVPWKDETGDQHIILVRDIDPSAVDALIGVYTHAATLFNAYFEKHVAMIREQAQRAEAE